MSATDWVLVAIVIVLALPVLAAMVFMSWFEWRVFKYATQNQDSGRDK